jgi:exopolysaccharide production protein ExoQ
MLKTLTRSSESSRTVSSAPTIDKYAIVTIFACAYATVIGPFLTTFGTRPELIVARVQNAEPGLVNRIFVPAMAAVSIVLFVRNHSRLRRWPPHMICLLAYVAFAGMSVAWAFRPEASFVRFAQQIMLLSSIVLPAMLAARTADLVRGMFLCFAVGAVLNIFLGYQNLSGAGVVDGYSGYLMGKNALGEFSGITFLLALHEMLYPGFRRTFGMITVINAALLLLWSHSKTAFALALVCPFLAGAILVLRKATQMSPAIIILSAVLFFNVVSSVTSFNMSRVGAMLFHDWTFSGRIFIWDFAFSEIARRPLLGWGYQSFWLVGSDAPSVVEAPGWIGNMPNAHNSYYDTMLELGYVGYALLIIFVFATLHAIGRVVDSDRGRGWFVLTIALYIIVYGFLESFWMRGVEPLWVVFVILALDIGRYWHPFPERKGTDRRAQVRGSPRLLRPLRPPT